MTKQSKNFFESDKHTTHEGQQLTGQLEYVAPLKWPLKCYIRALHNVIPKSQNPNELFQLTPKVTRSLIAWQRAIKLLDATKLQQITNPPTKFDIEIVGDSSDDGYGWMSGQQWAYGAFYPDEVDPGNKHNIRERELYAPATALTTLGPMLRDKHVLIWSDNKNAVQALTNKDIRNEDSQELVIYICELAMKFGFRFYIEHIKGKANEYADALSRLQIPLFLQKCKQTNKQINPTPTQHARLPLKLGPVIHTTHAPININYSMKST